MENSELLPHLFRTEYSKLVAVLSRLFGLEQLQVAEDIASETFLQAAETWPYKGIPENPAGWLYTVAKNKTKNLLARNQLFREKIAARIKEPGSQEDPLQAFFPIKTSATASCKCCLPFATRPLLLKRRSAWLYAYFAALAWAKLPMLF